LPVRKILRTGICDGVVHVEVEWESDDGIQESPSIEPFHAIDDPKLLYDIHAGWLTYPEKGSPRDDIDAAAGNPYWGFLEQGYHALLETIAQDCIDHSSLKGVYSKRSFCRMALQMLTSIPVPVLQGICGAGLRARKASSEDMYAWLTNNLRKSEGRPSIYMIELSDQVGQTLTYKDVLALVAGVRQYLNLSLDSDIKFAVEVEKIASPYELTDAEIQAIEAGERQWCANEKAHGRLMILLTSLESLIQSDLAQNPDESRRMPFAMRDIGYSSQGVARLNAHLDLTSSGNKFLVLFALVAKAKGLKYSLHGDYIFLAFREDHAIPAEIMFSLLAESYTVTGKGFNSVQAGQSMGVNDQVPATSWRLWQKDVLEESPVKGNAAAERARMTELKDEIEAGERRIVIQQIRALQLVQSNWDIIRRGI
jgi:hypothetical protein